MRPHLLELGPEALAAHLGAQGVPCTPSEARRALRLAWSNAQGAPEPVRPLRRALLDALAEHTRAELPEVLQRVPDPADGSTRLLLRSGGALFESVLIPLHRPGHYTLCVSSQAGCAMACAFCATGRLGLGRHLEVWEITAQLALARREAPGPVRGVVFMGQGEPLHNYERTLAAAALLCDPNGGRVSAEAISISTVGLVPQIRRYTAEGHRYRLIVSLSSAVPERRAHLLPVAGRTPIEELAQAVREHAAARRQRVTLAWVLMSGVNTGPDEVEALARFIGDTPVRLNLIDVNESRPEGFTRAGDAERAAFVDALQVLGVPVVRRFSVGRAQSSACGMLAARWG